MPSFPATVVIVGTSHTIQTSDVELKSFLLSLCGEFKVRAVAEEMNQEALSEKGLVASIPLQVASALQMPHRFCDPNRIERAKLAIRQEHDIRIDAWLSRPKLSESYIAMRVAESHAKREKYWLKQLSDLDEWPVLFICGADHVSSFCQLLKQQAITAYVAAEDWAPDRVEGMGRKRPALN